MQWTLQADKIHVTAKLVTSGCLLEQRLGATWLCLGLPRPKSAHDKHAVLKQSAALQGTGMSLACSRACTRRSMSLPVASGAAQRQALAQWA